jgi:3-hydroxyisobutyrate dehydrogenase-like beta-hydroxyacid dehydrogenase
MSDPSDYNVVVVGIGAMGGGMARALLDSPITNSVIGYDKSVDAVEKFFEESKVVNKACEIAPTTLSDSISESTNFVILSLVSESQCEQVCFAGDESLLNLMPKGSCVVAASTVTGKVEQGEYVVRETVLNLT